MKILTSLVITVLMTALIMGCGGNSIERDAQRVADLICQSQELAMEAAGGDMSLMEESERLMREAEALQDDLESKYANSEDAMEFTRILSSKVRDCN